MVFPRSPLFLASQLLLAQFALGRPQGAPKASADASSSAQTTTVPALATWASPTTVINSAAAVTTIQIPAPTTFTNTDGTRFVIKNAPTSIVLQVQPTPSSTQVGSVEGDTYVQACFPSTDPSCCYLGTDTVISDCLWEAADIPSYLASLPLDPANGNWVTTLGTQVAGAGQNLKCTIATGCNWPIPGASGNDINVVKAVIALVAAENWFTYQYINYQMVSAAMGDFLSGTLENVYNQLYETKHQNGAWEAINDGLAIVAAIVAVCAVPLTAGTSAAAAATILAASLGASGGVGNLITQMTAVSGNMGDYQSTHNFFTDLQNSWTGQLEAVANDFTVSATYAAGVLNIADGLQSGWLTIPQEVQNNWNNPQAVKNNFTTMLTAYGAARTWQSNGIFLHWESQCLSSATGNDYPSQQCITHSDSMMSVNNNYVFPVQFQSNNGMEQTPNEVRRYGLATNWPGISHDPDWSNVYIGSYKCQYHYHGTSGFPSSPYPSAQFDLSSLVMGDISPVDIPCLYNLPICDSGDQTAVSQCVDSYGQGACCTNHNGHDHSTLEGWFLDNSQKSDNFGLDNYCSGQLKGGFYQVEDVGLSSC